ncbi:MAG: sigma-54-dependent transcriptional regulator [Colwellia sp.]
MSQHSTSVLVVEDDNDQRELIKNILINENYHVLDADSVEAAILIIKEYNVDVIFSDWHLGDLSGIDLLNYVKKNNPTIGFAIATAYGTIKHAVDAIQQGADDYLAKPFQRQTLLLTIDKTLKAAQLKKKNSALEEQLSEQNELSGIIGKAPCMQKVFQRISRVSSTNATVLILGESGTGKELCARSLHNMSSRKDNPFIAINCGAIPESLAEAELFGSEKGAYTGSNSTRAGKFEAAHNGTLFLDEIGELPLSLQPKLLRLLQEGTVTRLGGTKEIKVDVRIIAATHQNLEKQVKENLFREDLYYRLNVVPIKMPALRERQADIPQLAEHFITLHSKRHNCPAPSLTKESFRVLLDYYWPGNVRELSNRLERFVLLDDEQELLNDLNSLESSVSSTEQDDVNFTLPVNGLNWQAFERKCLADALALSNGNKTKAASFLQMSYKAFLYRLEKFQLS